MKGLDQIMKQAQRMQEDLQKARDEIALKEVTGESGAGLVKVLMTGAHDVRRVSIDSSLLQEDRQMLEDLVAAAVNDAVRRVQRVAQERMTGLAAGLGLPPGMKPPF